MTVYENTMAGTWSLGVNALLEPHLTINDTISNTSRLFIFTEVNDSVMIINTGYNTKLRRSQSRKQNGLMTRITT